MDNKQTLCLLSVTGKIEAIPTSEITNTLGISVHPTYPHLGHNPHQRMDNFLQNRHCRNHHNRHLDPGQVHKMDTQMNHSHLESMLHLENIYNDVRRKTNTLPRYRGNACNNNMLLITPLLIFS